MAMHYQFTVFVDIYLASKDIRPMNPFRVRLGVNRYVSFG